MIAPLIRKLAQLGPLSEQERELLGAVSLEVRHVEAQQVLIQDGIAGSHCHLLLDGIAYRYRMTDGCRRHILSFHVAGDILDLASLLLGKLDYDIGLLTQGSVALIPHAVILSWMERLPRLGQLLWRDTLLDAAILGEWVVNVTQRTAHARIAHLLCELTTRMRVADPAKGTACNLPVTHLDLADATGLSSVHVSRILRDLRDQELLTRRESSLVVRDWEGLKRIAEYDQTYLHQLSRPLEGASVNEGV